MRTKLLVGGWLALCVPLRSEAQALPTVTDSATRSRLAQASADTSARPRYRVRCGPPAIKHWTPQLGYLSQRNNSTGIATGGVLAGIGYHSGLLMGYLGPGVGAEYLPTRGVLAPKVWCEAGFFIFTARLDLGLYRYAAVSDLRLTPQVGLSLFSFVNAYYGYQVPVAKRELDFMERQRLTITLNFFRPDNE